MTLDDTPSRLPTPVTCDAVRACLLDHVYGALEPAESALVASHLEGCASCREALDSARAMSGVLAAAARSEADDVVFEEPQDGAASAATNGASHDAGRAPRPRRAEPLITRPWRIGLAAAVLAALAIGTGDALLARHNATDGIAVLEIDAPSTVARGVQAEFRVTARTLGGDPAPAQFVAAVEDRIGTVTEIGRAASGADGAQCAIPFDPASLAPGTTTKVEIQIGVDGRRPVAVHSFAVHEATRLVTRVSTDKPLYRPGESVRVRGVALESLRLTPAGDTDLRLRLLDPKGAVALDGMVPTKSGVTGFEHALPADAAGGTWKWVLSGVDGQNAGSVAQAEGTFRVRSYRVPRLRFDLAFDRTSYRLGEKGTAMLRVKRAEGGVPVGAPVEAKVLVDGDNVFAETEFIVHEDGGVAIPFEVTDATETGQFRLAVTVRDGGSLESVVRTIPVIGEFVRFEAFPEGGTLVAGLPNRVYFRAKSTDGAAADLDAELVDGNGTRVAAVKSDVRGMGAFDLTPKAGETYRVVRAGTQRQICEGTSFTAEKSGTTLRSLDDEVPAKGVVRVQVGSTAGGRHTVGAWCRGVQVGETVVDVPAGGTAEAQVRLRTEVGGVLRVTAFDPRNRPVAERLVSRRPVRRLDVAVTPARAKTAPRQAQQVAFRVTDEKGAPAQAILGATVVDASVLSLADDRDTAPMAFHYLVGMEVEELEEAAVYTDGPDTAHAVDRLLGVQGWRRFAWKNPAAFAQEHPDAGPRVAPVGSESRPVRWSNEATVRREVDRAVERSIRNSTGLLILGGVGVLFIGGLVVGARASKMGRNVVATLAFTFPVLLGLVGFAAIFVPTMQSSREMPLGEDDETGDLTFGKYIEYGSGGSLTGFLGGIGDRVMDRFEDLEKSASDGIAVTSAAPMAAAGRAHGPVGAKSESKAEGEEQEESALAELSDEDRDAEEAALREGGERLRKLREDMNKRRGNERGDDDEEDWKSANRGALRLVREYAHKAKPPAGVRDDYAEVLAWAALLVTDEKGEARISFDTSDSLTSFRVLVDAHDGRGALGSGASEFSNRIPFFAEPKFPVALTAGDEVDLPVVVANDGDTPLDARVRLTVDGRLLSSSGDKSGDGVAAGSVSIAAGARSRVLLPLTALQGRGATNLDLEVSGGPGLLDRSRRTIEVHPRGFPIVVNRSGLIEKAAATTVEFPERLNRITLRGGLRIYPSTLATLVDGLDAMLQEPYGCFEQASSTNYPNVLVLEYLQEQRAASPELARRANDLLASGYRRLSGYECKSRGYEWFGHDPGHTGLTAYGILQFADMAKVYPVDAEMTARTRAWLLARRDPEGGYVLGEDSHSFGRASREISDSYIAWALSEADTTGDLSKEMALLEKRARDGKAPYVLALAANVFQNRGHASAKATLDRLAALQRADGGFDAVGTSITHSEGPNLEVETTALAALAFAKAPDRLANGEAAVRFLLASRQGGRFGATQATILALKALTAHAKASRRTATDHDLRIVVNGTEVAARSIVAGTPGVIEVGDEVVRALVPGENKIELRTTGAEALPWALALDYATDLPASEQDCAIGIETSLATTECDEGGSVTATVVVRNRRDEAQAMTLARVGVPAGLEPRTERLEELKKAGTIDFFELRPREVVLYWRGMKPKEERRVAFDLTAAIPGRFEGPASSAYLYYGDDKKAWAAGLKMSVR